MEAIILLWLAAVGLILGPSAARPSDAPEKDTKVRLTIRVADPQSAASLRLYVGFENVGDTDTVLNLGTMLGNGRVQIPGAVRLILTDLDGRSRELRFFDRRYPGIAGRVDDYAVPLRGGSVYTLNLRLNDFWCPQTNEFTLELKPGKYTVRAEFTGQEPQHVNMDTEGLKLMRFWTGTLRSDAVQFESTW